MEGFHMKADKILDALVTMPRDGRVATYIERGAIELVKIARDVIRVAEANERRRCAEVARKCSKECHHVVGGCRGCCGVDIAKNIEALS
jgi:hypothetical protein